MIHYKIASRQPAAHYFDITLSISRPDPEGQILRLPAWIPGSYMIRDFARNIIEINAFSENRELTLNQLDKSSWQLENYAKPVKIIYRVYAWDLSVRSAHLDTTHGYFNGSSVFLEVVGQADKACEVQIVRPAQIDCDNWKLATTLNRKSAATMEGNFDFGMFQSENYLDLIDHPVEMGPFLQLDFLACGIRHDIILTGKFNCDTNRLRKDLKKICEQHINMFGAPAPMARYMFQVMVVDDGYGGLEHKSSTSLICARHHLPQPGQSKISDSYRDFLGLCSHEYFHSWNVKRIKPKQYENPDLRHEVYTPLLWAFEGITSYYDDLALVRCGLISISDYLQLLGQTVTRIERGLGSKRQSVAQSSFNAWTRFYKQDENAQNSIVSYYAKGSLIALCIDLKIRQLTENKKSLDDVMRSLWLNYQQTNNGIDEHEIQRVINQVTATDLSDFLNQMVYQASPLPLHELLSTISIKLDFRASSGQDDKGGKKSNAPLKCAFGATLKESESGLKVIAVKENGAAQLSGISAGDEIISINDLRVSMKSYESWIKLSTPGRQHELLAFRRDELMRFKVALQKPEKDTAVLKIQDKSDPGILDWLKPDRIT